MHLFVVFTPGGLLMKSNDILCNFFQETGSWDNTWNLNEFFCNLNKMISLFLCNLLLHQYTLQPCVILLIHLFSLFCNHHVNLWLLVFKHNILPLLCLPSLSGLIPNLYSSLNLDDIFSGRVSSLFLPPHCPFPLFISKLYMSF